VYFFCDSARSLGRSDPIQRDGIFCPELFFGAGTAGAAE